MLTLIQSTLLDALIQLRRQGPKDATAGICYNVRVAVRDRMGAHRCGYIVAAVADELDNLYLNMGFEDPSFPVAGGADKYDEYSVNKWDMWDRDDEYGAARWALLQDMIDYLTELERQ